MTSTPHMGIVAWGDTQLLVLSVFTTPACCAKNLWRRSWMPWSSFCKTILKVLWNVDMDVESSGVEHMWSHKSRSFCDETKIFSVCLTLIRFSLAASISLHCFSFRDFHFAFNIICSICYGCKCNTIYTADGMSTAEKYTVSQMEYRQLR